MARRADDRDIDRLYQLPLADFTSQRNALAKDLGGDAGQQVRALQKPSVTAWGVNQLYWRDRAAYDALIAESQQLRAAHRAVLGGRKADLRSADAAHREAVKGALASTLRLLSDAGQTISSATQTELSRTLESLPVDEPPGRLVRALLPGGFEALQGLPIRAPKTPAPPKDAAPKDDKAARERQRKEAQRALEAARRQEERDRAAVARLQEKFTAAERASEAAHAAWERARDAAARLQQELRRAEGSLERSRKELQARREET